MHKKIAKTVTSSLMAASMLASTAALFAAPMSANAGNQLGQNDFDEGIGLPWHCCETQPAKQTFDIDDGVYTVNIITDDGPESRWDLQFRHRGLHIESGHTYEIAFDVEASADGEFATHIADLKGENPQWLSGCEGVQAWNYSGQTDPNGYEHTKNSSNLAIKKGKNHYEGTFTAKQTLEVAEWAFHYGGKGDFQDNDCFPDGTILKFDNMVLTDTTSDEFDFDVTNEFGVIRPRSNVRFNQLGYYTNLQKKASYVTDNKEPMDFEIRDSSGSAVYKGTTKFFGEDPDSGNGVADTVKIGSKSYKRNKDSGQYVHIIDFSEFNKPGKYTIFVKDTVGVSGTQSGALKGAYDTKLNGEKLEWTNPKSKLKWTMNESFEFEIGDEVYSKQLLKDSVNYYYQNRSGVAIESSYITSGDKSKLAHQAGHTTDKAYVQSEWVKFYEGDFSDGDKDYQIDGKGGWYDAGDHGKYVVNGGVSVWTLQNTYELSKKLGTDDKWTKDAMTIPESGDSNPDILDEARYELEWMLKMIVKSDDPFWGKKCEGMVYHKLHDHKWTGLATKAWDYQDEWETVRIVKPPTYAASLNLAACGAQAYRLWKGIDDKFAEECLEAAKTAYAAVKKTSGYKTENAKEDIYKTDPQFAPLDQAIGGGPYGDTYVLDDFYWAGCELYIATGDEEYYNDIKAYKNKNDSTGNDKAFSITTNLGGGENKGSFSSFNWGCTSGLGTLSLYLNPDCGISTDEYDTIVKSIVSAGDDYIKGMSEQGMGIPYRGSEFTDPNNIGNDDDGNPIVVSGYEWGSNSFVINNALVLAYAYCASGSDVKYLNGAVEAMDYLFGRNGLGFSYVTGYGEYHLQYPHHRWWAIGVDPEFPKAPDGVLSGGPGAGMQDPYVGGLGYKRGTVASQKCFVDNAEAWSVNEVTINWNAPLVAMASFMNDIVTEGAGNITPITPTKPSEGDTTKPSQSDSKVSMYGDANCDGKVTLSDALAILQFIANEDKYPLTAEGQANADCVDAGKGITAQDAVAVQMVDTEAIAQSKLPITAADLK